MCLRIIINVYKVGPGRFILTKSSEIKLLSISTNTKMDTDTHVVRKHCKHLRKYRKRKALNTLKD